MGHLKGQLASVLCVKVIERDTMWIWIRLIAQIVVEIIDQIDSRLWLRL